jgi:hypothetical protein
VRALLPAGIRTKLLLVSAALWLIGCGDSPTEMTELPSDPLPPGSTDSPYAVTIRWIGAPTAAQQSAVSGAVERWREVLRSELNDVSLSSPAGACFERQPAINEVVDDLLLYVVIIPIDGPHKILGRSGPCYVRSSGLPVVGVLTLDSDDLARMESLGTLDGVVLHEIGHVLGFGTLWRERGLLVGTATGDPRFTGAHAVEAFNAIDPSASSVPVENYGNEGTRNGHWRDSVFESELMTGYITGRRNPLSAVTVGSFRDLGYLTDPAAADAFARSSTTGLAPEARERETLQEVVVPPRFRVDASGRTTELTP